MVELQPSKLVMGVRFPSPALYAPVAQGTEQRASNPLLSLSRGFRALQNRLGGATAALLLPSQIRGLTPAARKR